MSGAPESTESVDAFQFHELQTPSMPNYTSKETGEKLSKWNLDQHAQLLKFRFDQPFERFKAGDFVRDFFSDPTVQACFKVVDRTGGWVAGPGVPTAVDFEQLNTTVTSLSVFDALKSEDLPGGPIVRDNGKISGCFEEWESGLCLQDRLRVALAKPDSEDYDALPETLRQELIVTLFRHLCLGGGMMQWEDYIEPYLEATRGIYKDMLSVRKNTDTGKVQVSSLVYKVNSVEANTGLFAMPESPNNLCVLCVDPVPRHVLCYYFSWYNSLA